MRLVLTQYRRLSVDGWRSRELAPVVTVLRRWALAGRAGELGEALRLGAIYDKGHPMGGLCRIWPAREDSNL